jgi:dCMP deaminase
MKSWLVNYTDTYGREGCVMALEAENKHEAAREAYMNLICHKVTSVVEMENPPPKPRPDWRTYFLDLAEAASARAECTRRKVGAVLVKDNRVRGVGYNGALPGYPSCLEGACPRATAANVVPGQDYSNCIADHAERNLLRNSRPEDAEGGVVYVNTKPCQYCKTLLGAAGVDTVVWPNGNYILQK